MIIEITNVVHRFTLCVLVNILCILLCVTFGVVHLFACVGLSMASAVVTYRMLMIIAEQQRAIPTSIMTDILKKFHKLTTTTTTANTKESSLDSIKYEGDASENQLFQERNNCVPDVMFEVDLYVQYVMRDFVTIWYQNLSPNEQFLFEIQYALEDLSIALVSRARKLGVHHLLHRAFCVYHRYFLSYLDALSKVRLQYQRHTLESCLGSTDAVQSSFTDWHFALSSPVTEMQHLHNVVNILLEVMVPADVLSCTLGRKLVVTLLVHKVLRPLVDLLSDPHWFNQKIIALIADPNRIAAAKMDTSDNAQKEMSENELAAPLKSIDTEDSRSFVEGSFSDGNEARDELSKSSLLVGDLFESFDAPKKPDTLIVGSLVRGAEDDAKDELISRNVPPVVAAEAIWQRLAGDSPAAFRSERDQEVSEMVQEASAGLEKKRTLKIPLSGSLDRISDMFSSTISFESISNNLAQYFKLGTDETKYSTSQSLGDACKQSSESIGVDCAKKPSLLEDTCIKTTSNESAIKDNREGEVLNPDFHVSSVLERFLPMTTGPVLSDQLPNIDHKPSVKDDKLFNLIASKSTEPVPDKTEPLECLVLEMQEQCVSPQTSFESNKSSDSQDDGIDIKKWTPELGKIDSDSCGFSPFGSTFMNLVIVCTEIVNENLSGTQYVLYCIQYDAWYHDPNSIKVVDVEHYVDILEPRTILQKGCVRRRFREFVTLHTRLEEDPKLRPLMKKIKGPNKWSMLPFSKLDKEVIAERRRFLEKYLQILVSKEEIASSSHLREFLAYGNDPSIAYARKAADIGVPRIDKFLMRTVTGVFDKLKTALPSLPHDSSPVEPTNHLQKKSDRLLGFLNFNSTLTDETPLRHSFDFTSDVEVSRCLEEQLGHFLGCYDINYDKIDTAYEAGEMDMWTKDPWSAPDGKPTGNQESESITTRKTAFHKDTSSVDFTDCLDNSIPLASAILNFIVDTVQDEQQVNQERFVHISKIILGPLLERWVSQLIDTYSSEAMFAKYLKMIREVVWPNGILLSQATTSPTDSDKRRTYDITLEALIEYFPRIIVLLLGKAQYESGMKLFLDSFQHPKLLRHLIYQLMDLLVDVLLIRSRSQSIIEKLGSLS